MTFTNDSYKFNDSSAVISWYYVSPFDQYVSIIHNIVERSDVDVTFRLLLSVILGQSKQKRSVSAFSVYNCVISPSFTPDCDDRHSPEQDLCDSRRGSHF